MEWFSTHQQPLAAALLRTNASAEVNVWSVAEQYRLRHTPLLASLGQLNNFQLKPYQNGFLAIFDPTNWTDQPALTNSFADHQQWNATTGVHSIGQMNELRIKGEAEVKDYMLHAEFRQEDKLSKIAQMIHSRGKGQADSVRVLCIAGPTSSGKTTFATKLAMYLRNQVLHN